MSGLLGPLAKLFCFRGSLEPLRDSLALAIGIAAICIVLSQVAAFGPATIWNVLFSAMVSALFMIAVPWSILRASGRDALVNKTLLALSGTDLASIVLMMPGFHFFPYDEQNPSPSVMLPVLLWLLAVLFWGLAVKIRIWMHAISRSAVVCLFLVLILSASEFAVMYFLPV
ncbi:MAG TPA: hypothetical protein VJ806_02465 [Luteimonas sp.]|nr:hypothetical protein [Luteimonas sp.]